MQSIELVKGDCVHLMDFGQTDPSYKRRLLSLGLTQGVMVWVTRVAPLGCPIQIEVRGTSLTVRKEEISKIEWKRV